MKNFLYEWIKYSVILLLFVFSCCAFGIYPNFDGHFLYCKTGSTFCSIADLILYFIWGVAFLYFYLPGLYLLKILCNLGLIRDFLYTTNTRYLSTVVSSFMYGGIIVGINLTADVLNRRKQCLQSYNSEE